MVGPRWLADPDGRPGDGWPGVGWPGDGWDVNGLWTSDVFDAVIPVSEEKELDEGETASDPPSDAVHGAVGRARSSDGPGTTPGVAQVEAAFREHGTALLRLAVLLTGDRHRADDIVQDAFVRYARASRPPVVGAELSYLRRTVINLTHDSHRRLAVVRRHDRSQRDQMARRSGSDGTEALRARQSAGSATATGGADGELERRQREQAVLGAIAELPSRQRECIVLAYYQDCTESEIAGALRISVGSVKTHLHRGRAALAKALEDQR